jgi:hypothetical protein
MKRTSRCGTGCRLLEKSLGYYQTILPRAKATAKKPGLRRGALAEDDQPQRRGIPFARSGRFSSGRSRIRFFMPNCVIAPMATGPRWRNTRTSFLQTAEFMASMPTWDEAETFRPRPDVAKRAGDFSEGQTLNPTFELTYWRWGLETAQTMAPRGWACRASRKVGSRC